MLTSREASPWDAVRVTALEDLATLVPPPTDHEDLTAAWVLASEMLGVSIDVEYVSLINRYGAGDWASNLRLYGPRELFVFSASARTGTTEWPMWPADGGAIEIGHAIYSDVDVHLLPGNRAHTIGLVRPKDDVRRLDMSVTEWLLGWLRRDHDMIGDAVEPGDDPGRTGWRDSLTAKEPSFEPTRMEPVEAGPFSQAAQRVFLRAELSPVDLPLEDRLRMLAEGLRPYASKRGGMQHAHELQPTEAYRAAPWNRTRFAVFFGPHRGNWCWYDSSPDGTAHRLGCFVADVEDESVRQMLGDLAAALGSAVEEIEII